jgi:phospholipid/cholesterol/gamma-HCH transport system substrate-binding protein
MRLTRRVLVNAVAFAALATLLVVLLAVRVLPTAFGRTYTVSAIVPSAGGVAPEQEVTYRGVQVGRVGRMTLTRDAVRIEMRIEAGVRIPREGTRARVLFKSAVGEQFVDLLPERDGPPYLRDGDVIPIERTSIPVQTEDLLRELDAVLRSIDPAALAGLVHELGQGLGGHGQDLRDLVRALATLAEVAARRRGEIAATVRDAASVQSSFAETREEFVRAADALRAVVGALAERRADVDRALAGLREAGTEILALLRASRKDVEQVVADLGTTVRLVHDRRGDVDLLLRYLGPFVADAVRAYDAPYFVFNLVANPEDPQCSYDPSGRPVRAVGDTSPREPPTGFACPADAALRASGGIAPLPAPLRIRQERLSWVRLFLLGMDG